MNSPPQKESQWLVQQALLMKNASTCDYSLSLKAKGAAAGLRSETTLLACGEMRPENAQQRVDIGVNTEMGHD